MLVAVYDTLKEAGYDTAAVFGLDRTEKAIEKKEEMQTFLHGLGFVVYFILFCLLVYMFTGEKNLRYFLYVILLGMVLTNTGKITDLLGRLKA